MTFNVSQSKVKTWRRCRHAYHLKYVEKLRRKKKSRPLIFGSIVHEMIEKHLNGDDPMSVIKSYKKDQGSMLAQNQDEYGDLLQDITWIMTEYFRYWEKHSEMVYFRKSRRSAEHHFNIEIFPDVWWNGKIDAKGKENGLQWLVEHKSFNRRPSDDDRWRNLQSVTYFRANDILGWKPVDGACWDYIWSKPPVRPKLLQSGKMSSKNVDTLPIVVRDTARELGISSPNEMVSKAENKISDYFFRVFTPVNESVQSEVFNDFVDTVREMSELHGKVKDRNIERHCSWCDYEPLCRARLQGLDHEFVKERQYEKDNRKKDVEAKVHTRSIDDQV